jgi:AraC-like DNA-binding protein
LDAPRGLLNAGAGQKAYQASRYYPSDDLALLIEHYWVVRWDVRNQEPFCQETLPHPAIHIALEPGRLEVYGVVEGRFIRVLENRGRVFGIMFRPGGFYPFYGRSVSELSNRIVPLQELFGDAGQSFGAMVAALDDDHRCMALAEEFLRAQRASLDEQVLAVGRIVQQIADDPGITQVEHLLTDTGLSKRTLQRLFDRYVGVSPKWVIQRYRLHEAIDRISPQQPVEWANLALDLGYFDQAHFIKHFKTVVGKTPEDYARSLR